MVEKTPAGRTRILDAAERLFAAHGYEAVSMREVAREAEVSLALLTYHFGTKDRLYREIFERRRPVLDERLEHLRRADPAVDPIDHLVAAFVEPQMRLRETPQGLAFAQLVAREATDPSAEDRGIIEDLYDPMAREFIAALQELLPEVPAERVRWSYLFAVGALSMSAVDTRVARFGSDAQTPLEAKTEMLKAFLRAGWTA